MTSLLKRLAKAILRTVVPNANPYLIAQRLEEMPSRLRKRVRSVALNTVSRLKGAPDHLPLPPAQLMFLVQGTTNVREFLTDGRGTALGVLDVLKDSGIDIDSSKRILDFGCGCGRVIRHLYAMTGARFHGSDYNPQLIEWCKRNLRFAQFEVNGVVAPTRIREGTVRFGLCAIRFHSSPGESAVGMDVGTCPGFLGRAVIC